MKKLLVPLVVLLACAMMITGCSTSSPTSTTPAASQPSATQSIPMSSNAVSPKATNLPTTVATTTKPAGTTPASASNAKNGGFIRSIDPTSPATPIGVPWETSGTSGTFMQISLQTPIRELADGSIAPSLASSYDVVTDPANPSVTLHLQKGVKFSDGTDFNAQALKWNFDKIVASNMYTNVTSYWKSLEILDDYTLRINMTVWLNKSVSSFGNSVSYVVSPTAFDKNGIDWMRWNMVGTGPFIQTDFQKDVSLTTVRNTNYWEQGKPYLDKLQYLFVADEMTRIALFKSGGGEILNTNANGRLALDLQNAGYKIITQPSGVVMLVPDSLNADSPWANLKVRQAADYAIDKESMAKTFGYGFWTANYQLSDPTSSAYDKNIPGRKYDVAQAKQLLTDAGYPNGFKTTIIAQNTFDPNIVALVQSYLSKVGIQCDIQMVQQAKYTTYSFTSATWNNAIIVGTQTAWANPTTGLNGGFGIPSTSWQSTAKPPGWKEALTAAMTTPKLDPALVQKVEDMAYDYAMVIPLYAQMAIWAVNPNVQDSGLGTRGASQWWEPQNVWLSK
jgi:peptide/nickel transport system substrate-binding protein